MVKKEANLVYENKSQQVRKRKGCASEGSKLQTAHTVKEANFFFFRYVCPSPSPVPLLLLPSPSPSDLKTKMLQRPSGHFNNVLQ
jgi:hypothetical protein